MVTIYTNGQCPRCHQLKAHLKSKGINSEFGDVQNFMEDSPQHRHLRALPITKVGTHVVPFKEKGDIEQMVKFRINPPKKVIIITDSFEDDSVKENYEDYYVDGISVYGGLALNLKELGELSRKYNLVGVEILRTPLQEVDETEEDLPKLLSELKGNYE